MTLTRDSERLCSDAWKNYWMTSVFLFLIVVKNAGDFSSVVRIIEDRPDRRMTYRSEGLAEWKLGVARGAVKAAS
jgi:hypothetical protein